MLKKGLNMMSLPIILSCLITAIASCERFSASPRTDISNPNANPTQEPIPNSTPTQTTAATPTGNKTILSKPITKKSTTIAANTLKVNGSFLGKKNAEGKVIPVNPGIFKRGEDIYFVLLNVGRFKKGADGKHWLDMDILVGNSQGKIIAFRKNMLGGKGRTTLKDDVAVAPYGTVNINSKVPAGTYQIKLTIYDKVARTTVSASKSLTLR